MGITQLYSQTEKQRLALQEDIFQFPPKSMEEYQFRRGQWVQLKALSDDLLKTIKGVEDDT